MEMSWIQRHALAVLLRSEAARLKDMRPDDVAANLFTYHLGGLVAGNYITKSGRGVYQLTSKGLKLAGTFSTGSLRSTENIKTVVMLYGEHDGKLLLFRWSRQPYLGKVTLAYDRMALGTPLVEGVRSALFDKLGVEVPVAFMTSAFVRIVHQNETISHMNALVYRVNLDNVALPYVSRNGEAFLADSASSGAIGGLVAFLDQLRVEAEPFDSEWRF